MFEIIVGSHEVVRNGTDQGTLCPICISPSHSITLCKSRVQNHNQEIDTNTMH